MKPLVVELEKGAKRQFQSIGWKIPTIGDYRRHFYAVGDDGRPLVVSLKIAMPDYYDPCNLAKTVLVGEPFPEAVCVEISRCRLLPPPCYQSLEEMEGQQPFWPIFEPWRSLYHNTQGESLTLKPSDDGPLQKCLDQWLAKMRYAYQTAGDACRTEIKRVKGASLQVIGFDSEVQRSKRLDELKAQLAMVQSENPIDGVPSKGRLKLTLEAVKQGHEGIRDHWMHEQWAAKHGENLVTMAEERRVFCRWLEKRTGTPADIYDSTTRQKRHGFGSPDFGEGYEANAKFLEACAVVRYRARFSDNAGTVIFLADCELREELTASELDDVAKLKPGNQTTTTSTARSNAPLPFSHSPALFEQFEYVNVQHTEWRKAGAHMFRRQKLAASLAELKGSKSFRTYVATYPNRCYYPVKKIEDVLKASKAKKKLPAAAMFDITDWRPDWKPKNSPDWVHPGKKSTPINAHQG